MEPRPRVRAAAGAAYTDAPAKVMARSSATRHVATQVDRAYAEIKAAIIDGRYAAGTPMSEPVLAREHGMSRTPIREGLTRLWQEHYLERVAGHGYFVARVTVQAIHDTFAVRRLLEGAAAGRAAELARPDEIETLRTLALVPEGPPPGAPLTPAERVATYRTLEAANARFHMAVAATAGNGLAHELIERCLAQVDRFMSLGVNFGPVQEGATRAHLTIVDAIGRHDPGEAQRLMEKHLDVGSDLMRDALLRGPRALAID
jgi:DNA-binding GntR family transcriptional regulator